MCGPRAKPVRSSTPAFHDWLTLLAGSEWDPDIFGEDYEPSLDRKQGELFLRHCIQLFNEPDVLSSMGNDDSERAVWNLANWLGTAGGIIDSDRLSLPLRLEMIREAYTLFDRWFGTLESESAACDMFWDIVVGRGRDLETPIAAAMFHALEKQLTIPNRWCQLSALHGFGHLKDIGCRPIIDLFQQNCTDKDLYDYAASAKQFEVL